MNRRALSRIKISLVLATAIAYCLTCAPNNFLTWFVSAAEFPFHKLADARGVAVSGRAKHKAAATNGAAANTTLQVDAPAGPVTIARPPVTAPFDGDPRLEPIPDGPIHLANFDNVFAQNLSGNIQQLTMRFPPRVNGQVQSDGDKHSDMYVLFYANTGAPVPQPPIVEAVPKNALGSGVSVEDGTARLYSAIWELHAVTVDASYNPNDPGMLIDSLAKLSTSPWLQQDFQTNIFLNCPIVPAGTTIDPVPGGPGPNDPKVKQAFFNGQMINFVPYDIEDGAFNSQILFNFVDANGNVLPSADNPRLVASHSPGDVFYSSIWELWTVHVPNGYDVSTLKSAAAVKATNFPTTSSGIRLNCPVVAIDGKSMPFEDAFALLVDDKGNFNSKKFPFDLAPTAVTLARTLTITEVTPGGIPPAPPLTAAFPPIDPDGKGNVIPVMLVDPFQTHSSGPNSSGDVIRFTQAELDAAYLNNNPARLPEAIERNVSALINAGLLTSDWAPGGRPYQERLGQLVGRALFELVWKPEQGSNAGFKDVASCMACHSQPIAGGAARGLYSLQRGSDRGGVINAGSMWGSGGAELLQQQLLAAGAPVCNPAGKNTPPGCTTFAHGSVGSIATLRSVTNGAFNTHMGMQTSEFISGAVTAANGKAKCDANHDGTVSLDEGATCDLDGDGVVNEMTAGEVTAFVAFMAALRVPDQATDVQLQVLGLTNDNVTSESVDRGKLLFRQSIDKGGASCASCHTPFRALSGTQFIISNPETSFGLPIEVSHHAADQDDVNDGLAATVGQPGLRIYGDFKLHKMGDLLRNNGLDLMKTAELWDAGSAFPFGRAGNFGSDMRGVILAHEGVSLSNAKVSRGAQTNTTLNGKPASTQQVTITNTGSTAIAGSATAPIRVVLTDALSNGMTAANAAGAAPDGSLRQGAFWLITHSIPAGQSETIELDFYNPLQSALSYGLIVQSDSGYSEAAASARAFKALSPEGQQQVVSFLRAQLIGNRIGEGSGDGDPAVAASARTLTDITSSNTTVEHGQPITFTSHVTSDDGAPSGTVEFFDGAELLGAANLSGGTATLRIDSFGAGTHAVTARFAGAVGFLASSSPILFEAVDTPAPVITWSAPADIVYGTPLSDAQLNATANVAGTFIYTPAAGAVLNAGANQSLTVNFVPSDPSTSISTSASVTINVLRAKPTVNVLGGTFTFNYLQHPAAGSIVGVNGEDLGLPKFTYTANGFPGPDPNEPALPAQSFPVPPAPAATTVNEPPAAPHQIIAFPERDFVSALGYRATDLVTVNVLRRDASGVLVTVGAAQGLHPQDDPKTPEFDGLVEVNHPGGACWEGMTPDIRPGDIVRLTVTNARNAAGATIAIADQTTVAKVATERAVQVDASTVVIHGTAQDASGQPLPLDQIEQRLISASANRFDRNGRRDLRAPRDGSLSYDAPGSIHWTATYVGLSAADVARALDAESRVLWLGRDPLGATELTIFEIGDAIFAGPQAPCSAPLEGAPPSPGIGPVPPAPAATTVNEPPAAPHQIIAFPERDFVSALGYRATDLVTVNVLRRDASGVLVTVGAAQGLHPQDDPKTPEFDGLVEVNHPGGGCWIGATPDIRPGDIIRITNAAGVADQTTVANVTATRPILTAADTVVIHGTAQDASGQPLPLDQIEQRLIARNQVFDLDGRRDVRAPGHGTFAYDAPGSIHWTATYSGLDAADVERALNAESRILWLGRAPLAATELTIFEIGDAVVGGPQGVCTAPLEGSVVPTFAGTYEVAASFAGNTNYEPASATTQITINKADPTVSIADLGPFAYDTNQHAATVAVAGVGGSPFVPPTYNATITYALSGAGTPFVNPPVNAGIYDVTATFAGSKNYSAKTASSQLVINKVKPTIIWDKPADINFGTPLGDVQLNAKASASFANVAQTLEGAFTFTPAAGTVLGKGADQSLSVSFAPKDSVNFEQMTATQLITVVNHAPVAGNQTATGDEDTPTKITLNSSDADGNLLTFSLVSTPTHGVLGTLSAPACTVTDGKATCTVTADYTPAADYNGADSLTFKTSDTADESGVATVSITVNPVNDLPVVKTASSGTADEGATFTLAGSFLDPDADTWTATVDYGDGTGASQPLALDANKAFQLSHVYDQNGAYTATVTVTDSAGTKGTSTVAVKVNNVAPRATFNAPQSVNETSPINLSLTGVADPSKADTAAGFSYAFDTGSGTYGPLSPVSTVSIPTTDSGSRVVRAKVLDRDGGVSEYTATVSILNLAPSTAITDAPATASEGTAINVGNTTKDVSPVDQAAGFSFSWVVTKNGTAYTAGTGASFRFTPNDNGSYVVQLTAADKDGGQATATSTINVTNVAPTVGAISWTNAAGAAVDTMMSVKIGTALTATASFADAGTGDTHTAAWDWDANHFNGSTLNQLSNGTVAETQGAGTVKDSHTYTAPGIYTVKLTVKDKDTGAVESIYRYVVVIDPAAGSETGTGVVNSPAGSFTANTSLAGTAVISQLRAAYQTDGTLNTLANTFRLTYASGSLIFTSSKMTWLVVSNGRTWLKGEGTTSAGVSCYYLVSVVDTTSVTAGVDKVRVKVWRKDNQQVIYDTQKLADGTSAPDDALAAPASSSYATIVLAK